MRDFVLVAGASDQLPFCDSRAQVPLLPGPAHFHFQSRVSDELSDDAISRIPFPESRLWLLNASSSDNSMANDQLPSQTARAANFFPRSNPKRFGPA
jgi:hypothetical protein